MRTIAALCLAYLALAFGASNHAPAAPPKAQFEIELGTEKGAPFDAPQKWSKLFADRSVAGVRVRPLEPGEQPKIDAGGTAASPTYRIFGTITAQNTLLVPGGKFAMSDGAALDKWLRELGENGVAGVTQKKTAFGLTPQQFAAIHDDLAQKVSFTTKGVAPRDVLSKLAAQLKTPIVVDPDAKKAIADDDPVRDELEGVSCGTAIAAILRPAGLVLVPRKPGGSPPELQVTSGKGAAEFWPIGWAPEKNVKDIAPIYFEFLNIEIDDITAGDAIAAIQAKLKVPFLYDHNGLARAKIDLDKTKIKVAPLKTFYLKALQYILQPANLKHEFRVDEAGSPFEWITPLREAK